MSSMTAVTLESSSSSSSLFACEKSDQVRRLINDNISTDGRERIESILRDVNQLNDLERLLLYMQLPGSSGELIKDTVTSRNGSIKSYSTPWVSGKKAEHEIALTYSWIRSHLERDQSFSLPKQEVYDDYKDFCQKSNIDCLCVADFGKAMKQIFPTVKPRRLGQRGSSKYCYAGLKKTFSLYTPPLPSITRGSGQETSSSGGDTCSSDPVDSILASISSTDVDALLKENSSDVSSNHSSNVSSVSNNMSGAICPFNGRGKSPVAASARVGKRKQSVASLGEPVEKKRRGKQVQQQSCQRSQKDAAPLHHQQHEQQAQQQQQQQQQQQHQQVQHHHPQVTASMANVVVKTEPSDSLNSVGHIAASGDTFHPGSTGTLNTLFGDTKSLSAVSQFTNNNSLDSNVLQLSLYDSTCDQSSDPSQFETVQATLTPFANEMENASDGADGSTDQISQLRKLLEQNLPTKKEMFTYNDVLTSHSTGQQPEVLDDGCNAYVYEAYNSSVIDSSVGNLLATSEELQNSAVASEISSAQLSLAQSPLISSQDSPLNQRFFQPIGHQAFCESNSSPSDSVAVASIGLPLTPSNSGSPFLSPRSTPVHQSGRSRNDSGQNASSAPNTTFFVDAPLHTHQSASASLAHVNTHSPFDSPVPTFGPHYMLGYNQMSNQLYPA